MTRQLTDIAVSDTGFVFDPSTGQTFWLNKTALFVVRSLQGGSPLSEVVGQVSEQFDVDKKSAAEDVREFMTLMNKMGFKINAS
ncbi:MAG: PqqD family protein [Elusimicrobia bacterium]|nr:PqqD family protein [Elusimicrobiota bacterium]